jgi:cytoskeletal protein CcmA (bactofilin family)
MWSTIVLGTLAAALPLVESYGDLNEKMGCTAIAVAPGATIDGSSISTHNADCLDVRIKAI